MSGAPDAPTRTLDHCLACGGARLRPLALRYAWSGLDFPAAECGACGMRFLRVQPVGETLARMYAAEYFATDFRCGRSDRPSDDADAFRPENRGLVDRFESLRESAGAPRVGRLLEVGCAHGLLLEHARSRGWSVAGVEFSADAAGAARARGLDVFTGTLEAAQRPAGSADLVYLGDVLEHVPDCRATLAEVARVLAPGGHLFLRGPITTNSLARSLALAAWGAAGRSIVLHEPPYHLWEFTPGPLARLARAVGLGEVRMEQAKIPPGRAHGSKSPVQRLVMGALDAVNVPVTRAFGVLGDRVVMTARRAR